MGGCGHCWEAPPKPRAVSSNLTAPAREKPVTTSVAGFCFFRIFEKKSDLCTFCAPFNFKSYFKVIWSPINKRLDVDIYGYVTVVIDIENYFQLLDNVKNTWYNISNN